MSPTMQIIGLPPGVQDIVVIFVLALAGRQALTRRTPPEPPADDANPAMQPGEAGMTRQRRHWSNPEVVVE
ncbi:hypothetical protein ACWGTI_01200 [Mesorhizobium sp. ArgA1]